MNYTPEWFQEFILNLNGDEIFWIPVIMVGLGLLFLWIIPSFKGISSTIVGWLLFAVMSAGASTIWFHIWDWREANYQQEAVEELEGVALLGDEVNADSVSADPYGVTTLSLDLEYDFGYSETFMIADVEDLIDYLVIQYRLADENNRDDSYIHQMRSFQELHVKVSAEGSQLDDVVSYHHSTLLNYAQEVSLIDPNAGYFWSDSEQSSEEEVSEAIDETGYRVVKTGYSPWHIKDEQASEGGIELGQWEVLSTAPDALEELNRLSCSVLNFLEECESEEPKVYHSVIMAFTVLIVAIIGVSAVELTVRRIGNRRNKGTVVPYNPNHAEESPEKELSDKK